MVNKHAIQNRFHWRNIKHTEHFVQFYEDDSTLTNSLINYIGKGVSKGDTCVVIATQNHRDLLEKKLTEVGISVIDLMKEGKYYAFDAQETLHKFMVGNMPDPTLFKAVIGSLLTSISTSHSNIRAFGEMVALLWDSKNYKAAIELEKLWNELGKSVAFSLFCAYPLDSIKKKGDNLSVKDICLTHSKILHKGIQKNENSYISVPHIFLTKENPPD